jgi:predicted PurR-regulated permease PerM
MEHNNQTPQQTIQRPLSVVAAISIVALLLYLLRHTAIVLFIAFAGVLAGVFLDGAARILSTRTPLHRRAALVIVIALLLLLIGLPAWLLGPRVAEQIVELARRAPRALESIRGYLLRDEWGRTVLESLPDGINALSAGFVSGVTNVIQRVIEGTASAAVMLVLGLFLAFSPEQYMNGALLCFPPRHRDALRDGMRGAARSLRRWLLARFMSMAVVGILTGVGLAITGMPLALTLGVIAGALSFIPYLGPLLSVLPGMAIALESDPALLPWAMLVYAVVQVLESNFITPLIEQETTSVPAALLITMQVLLTMLAGALGILLAAPLTVAAMVFVQLLYVRRILGDDIPVMGQRRH